MIVYLDTSALIKFYIRELGSDKLTSLIEKADVVGTAVITYVEMASALAKAARMNWVDREGATVAWTDFLSQWPAFTRIAVTASLTEWASRLAWDHGLRGYDAVHLASALTWQEAVDSPVLLATFDKELWAAAEKVGMEIWPGKANL